MIDCKETLARFYDYLDSELSVVHADEVASHMKDCRKCFDRMEFEKAFGAFVKNECADGVEADALKAKIKERMAELECASENEDLFLDNSDLVSPEQGAEETVESPGPRRIPVWSYMLVAAAVVLMAIPFFNPKDHPPVADPMVMSLVTLHMESRPQMLSDEPVALASWLGERVSFDPMVQQFADAGCRVEGAAIDSAWSHLFVSDEDIEVSVFVGEKDEIDMPTDMSLITVDDRAFWTKEVNNYSVVLWESDCDGVVCAAVAMAGMDRVVKLARRVTHLDHDA